jgi:hypothetical protein
MNALCMQIPRRVRAYGTGWYLGSSLYTREQHAANPERYGNCSHLGEPLTQFPREQVADRVASTGWSGQEPAKQDHVFREAARVGVGFQGVPGSQRSIAGHQVVRSNAPLALAQVLQGRSGRGIQISGYGETRTLLLLSFFSSLSLDQQDTCADAGDGAGGMQRWWD